MPLDQSYREVKVASDLGDNEILFENLSASEHLSEPFTFVVGVIREGDPVDFTPLLGTTVSVAVDPQSITGLARTFSGKLFEAVEAGNSDAGIHYRLVLKPWLSLLGANLNARIFQNKSVLDIVKALVAEWGFDSDLNVLATGSYKTRPYCVQYRESDMAFISRLLEEEGLYYFFDHAEDRHVMTICDDVVQNPHSPQLDVTPYFAPDGGTHADRPPHLWLWSDGVKPGAATVSLRDYNFLKPDDPLAAETDAQTVESGPGETAELYDFPGGYGVYDIGDATSEKTRYTQMRLEASRAMRQSFSGRGDAFSLSCGQRFSLDRHPIAERNIEHLVVSAHHTVSVETYRSGGGSGAHMEINLIATPSATTWRAPLLTPKPVAAGPQTAKVVGPKGEVIYTDEHGRVKVQFRWDREGKFDENSSCWLRVSQGWADGGFGMMLLPRIGEEVIVDFLEGDPDQPIITGRVYNPTKPPPYDLPANKTRSTWKSHTVGDFVAYQEAEEAPTKDDFGSNEIRYEDKSGSEEVYVHAQRDMRSWIRNDENHKVGRDFGDRVGRDRRTEIKRNETNIVETGDEVHTVQQGSRNTTIHKAETLTVETGDQTETVQSGNFSLSVSKGKAKVEAKQEILLVVGDNSIRISPSGIEIQGLTVSITADTSLSAKGLTGELKAATQLTINGMTVMIN